MAAHMVVWRTDDSIKPPSIFSTLSVLSHVECLYTLAEWSSKTRIRRLGQVSDDSQRQNRLQLETFSEMVKRFPQELSDNDFRSIVNRLSGRLVGSYSASITEYFLIPLLNKKQISIERITSYWVPFAVSRLKNHIDRNVLTVAVPMIESQYECELVEVVVWSILNSSPEQHNSYVEELTALRNDAQRTMDQWH